MPHRIYRGSEPPRWWDPILAHPWELSTATFGIFGSVVAVAIIADGGILASATEGMHSLIVAAMLGMFAAGGILIWVGLLDHGPDLLRGWSRERQGLMLTAGAWGIYTGAIIVNDGTSNLLQAGIAAVFATAAILRLVATYREESTTRELIQ